MYDAASLLYTKLGAAPCVCAFFNVESLLRETQRRRRGFYSCGLTLFPAFSLPQSPTAEPEPQEVGRAAPPTSPSPISPPRCPPTSPSSASWAAPSRPSSCAKPTRRWCATAACRPAPSRSSSGSWSRAPPIRRPCPPSTAATATPAPSSQSRWSSFRARPRTSYWATATWRWTGGWRAKWWCLEWDPHVPGYRCRPLRFYG